MSETIQKVLVEKEMGGSNTLTLAGRLRVSVGLVHKSDMKELKEPNRLFGEKYG